MRMFIRRETMSKDTVREMPADRNRDCHEADEMESPLLVLGDHAAGVAHLNIRDARSRLSPLRTGFV